ncbi:hypothetical protein [Microbacterium sp. NPDC089695]|uniref:hypothetical protein n=1 Tax=Microbacterium sp. NPDC089695 TaxID=3364198 RepID=UPI003827FBBD
MTTNDTTARRTSALLPGAHRVLRHLAGGEGPYPGALVTDGEARAVMRDAEGLAGWGGWRLAGARHVAAPIDLVRRGDGHDVLLPWCTERVTAFLGRRGLRGEELSPGEVSTLVVSMLRGIGETAHGWEGADGRQEQAADGEWWLTDTGCPMFALGDGADVRAASATVIESIAAGSEDRVLRRLLDGIAEGLRRDRGRPHIPRRQLENWEAELLALASPRALACATDEDDEDVPVDPMRRLRATPGAARSDGEHGAGSPRRADLRTSSAPTRARTRSLARGRARGARERRGDHGGWAATIATLWGGVMERWREKRAVSAARETGGAREGAAHVGRRGAVGRRRVPMIAVGLAAAAVVLAGGLLWPGDATGESSGHGQRGSDRGISGRGASNTVAPDGDAAPPGGDALAGGERAPTTEHGTDEARAGDESTKEGDVSQAAALRLVRALRGCVDAADAVCADAVVSGAAHVLETFEEAGVSESEVEIVDDYGGAAVVRVSSASDADPASGSSSLMLVLVRVDEKWLVRDAYDVADQPG